MSFVERALTFECAGETLVGVLAEPAVPATMGVLIIVGGPQYRVGSHRQFVQLSRRLAEDGIAALRFDYRGMGDSTGAPVRFDEATEDIAAAIDAMRSACPALGRIVLCGLCDAASAALIYAQTAHDDRVNGIVLLNPWVRSEQTIARVRIKHYYARRIFQREFWAKVGAGGVDLRDAARSVARNVMSSRKKRGAAGEIASFQDRMASGLNGFEGAALLILSGRDLTAKEFLEYTSSNPRWTGLLDKPALRRVDVDEADHTFSSDARRREVEALISQWLKSSIGSGPA